MYCCCSTLSVRNTLNQSRYIENTDSDLFTEIFQFDKTSASFTQFAAYLSGDGVKICACGQVKCRLMLFSMPQLFFGFVCYSNFISSFISPVGIYFQCFPVYFLYRFIPSFFMKFMSYLVQCPQNFIFIFSVAVFISSHIQHPRIIPVNRFR